MSLNVNFIFRHGFWVVGFYVLFTGVNLSLAQTSEPAIDKNAPGYVGDCVDRLNKDPLNLVKPVTITKEQFVAVVKMGIDIYNSGKDLDSHELVERFLVTQFYVQHCGEKLATNGPLLKLVWEGQSGLQHISDYGLTYFQYFSEPSRKWKRFSFTPIKIASNGCYLRSELMRVLGDVTPSPTSNRLEWNLVWEKKIGFKGDRVLRFIGKFNQDCLSAVSLTSEQIK